VFTLSIAGASYQQISDTMNREKLPFSPEAPLWNKHKVKRLLENPRYTGADGYPAIIAEGTFQAVRERIQDNAARFASRPPAVPAYLKGKLRCGECGGQFLRRSERRQGRTVLILKCQSCGERATIPETSLGEQISRQMAAAPTAAKADYVPSPEVMRLANAVNRALEHPDVPEAVIDLILQSAAARYDCCGVSAPQEQDMSRSEQEIAEITVTAGKEVTVIFK
jgi:hypothetical protein